jgi:hypothetical protein
VQLLSNIYSVRTTSRIPIASSRIPRSRPPNTPAALNCFKITIELRTYPAQGLSDRPSQARAIPISLLLQEQFKSNATKRLRASHLSWDVLQYWMATTFQIAFDSENCELGYKVTSPIEGLRDDYVIVMNELNFHNAVSVLQNSALPNQSSQNLTFLL